MKRNLVMSMGLFLLALLGSSLGGTAARLADPPAPPQPSATPLAPAPAGLLALKSPNVAHVVVVAAAGGNFTAIQPALDSITDARATNPYVVKVAPGSYSERVTMKPFVDIEGSGVLTTKITYGGSASADTGTVIGARDAELRDLTVENTGGAAYAIAIYDDLYGLQALTNLALSATDGATSTAGLDLGNATATLNNVTIFVLGPPGASSYGVTTDRAGTIQIHNSTITATGGAQSYGLRRVAGSVDNSLISGGSNTIRDGFVLVGASKLVGGPVLANGTCAGVYDENYTFYPGPACP